MNRAHGMARDPGKEPDVLNEPEPEPDVPVWQMTWDQLSDYRRALIGYLGRAPEDAPRYMRMCARLTDVIAERQIRRIIEHFEKRTGAEPGRPPARAGLDTARAGPEKTTE